MKATADSRLEFPGRVPPREAPGVGGARDPLRPEHYYVGRRSHGAEVYVVSRAALEPLEHHEYRTSAPFDWGAPGPGALELAFAMLAHGTESRPPDLICVTFWSEVVARLDRPGFVLGHGDLALWLLTAFRDDEEPPPRGRLSLRDHVRRVRLWRRPR